MQYMGWAGGKKEEGHTGEVVIYTEKDSDKKEVKR